MSCCGGGCSSYSRGGKSFDKIIKDQFKNAKSIVFLIGKNGVSLNESMSCFGFFLHYSFFWSCYPDAGFSYYKKKFLIPSKKLKPTELHYKVAEMYSKLSLLKDIYIVSTDEYGLMKKCFVNQNIDPGDNLLQVGGTVNDLRCLNCRRRRCVNTRESNNIPVKCQKCKGLLKPAFYPFSNFDVSEDTKYLLRHLTGDDLIIVLGMDYDIQKELLYFAERRTWRVGFRTNSSSVYQSSIRHPSYRSVNVIKKLDEFNKKIEHAIL